MVMNRHTIVVTTPVWSATPTTRHSPLGRSPASCRAAPSLVADAADLHHLVSVSAQAETGVGRPRSGRVWRRWRDRLDPGCLVGPQQQDRAGRVVDHEAGCRAKTRRAEVGRSPSRAATSRSAPSAASTTTRSTRPRLACCLAWRPRRAWASASSSAAVWSESALIRKQRGWDRRHRLWQAAGPGYRKGQGGGQQQQRGRSRQAPSARCEPTAGLPAASQGPMPDRNRRA